VSESYEEVNRIKWFWSENSAAKREKEYGVEAHTAKRRAAPAIPTSPGDLPDFFSG
jgi:hypothetical protein